MKQIKEYMCDDSLPSKEEIIEAIEISKRDNCRVRIINNNYKAILVTRDNSSTDNIDRLMTILEEYHDCHKT